MPGPELKPSQEPKTGQEPESYQVVYGLKFNKVMPDGKIVEGMDATVTYKNMTYAQAVKAEACSVVLIESLIALGEENTEK